MGYEFYKLRADGIALCIFGGDIKVGGVRKCLVRRCDMSSFYVFFSSIDSLRAHQYPWHFFGDFSSGQHHCLH